MVALEAALLIEDRRAADAHIPGDAVRPNAAVFEVAEGLTSFKDSLVFAPGTRQQLDTGEFPAGLPKPSFGHVSSHVWVLAPRVGEAQVFILLPVPVG